MATLLAVLGLLSLFVVMDTFIIFQLYNWFILSQFDWAPFLSFIHVMGLVLFARFLILPNPDSNKSKTDRPTEYIIAVFGARLVILFIGFILSCFL